jgi:Flp pilus assembly protein TadD
MTLNNRHGDAIEILRWNVRHQSSVSRAHEVLGDALLRAGDADGARESLSEALKLDPGNQAIQEKLSKLPRSQEPGV